VLQQAGSVGHMFMVWICSGVLVTLGALTYAELGTALPKAGGELTYYMRAFGPRWSFIFVWSNFWVIKSGSQSIIALIFGTYAAQLWNGGEAWAKALAITCLWVTTGINCLGVSSAAKLQNAFTGLKVLGMAFIVTIGAVALTKFDGHFAGVGGGGVFAPYSESASVTASGFGVAMIASLWAYDGWNQSSYCAEEVIDVGKVMPRANMLGVAIVALLYVLMNAAYIACLPPALMSSSAAVGRDAASAVVGQAGAVIIPLIVAISTFGSCNGSILTGARVIFASARDGQLPVWCSSRLGSVHPKTQAPVYALLLQALWSTCLLLPGNFESLVQFFGFASWLGYGASGVALLRLRRLEPELTRPFKIPHPLIAVVFTGVSGALAVNALWETPKECALALLFMLAGYPASVMIERARNKQRQQQQQQQQQHERSIEMQ
jgi:amino acid transporter